MGASVQNMRTFAALALLLAFAQAAEDSYHEEVTPIVPSNSNIDCRTDKSTTPISIDFENKSGKQVRIRGCQNQYACKPFQDCVVGMEADAKAVVTIDSSFKYFIFTYHGDGRDTELYPDANLKYPDEYDIKPPSVQLAAGGSLPFVVTPIVPSNPNIDCRTDKSTTPISIDFENKSGKQVRIRGCQNQYACKPFQDCVVGMEADAKAVVTIDSSFKYFIFTYHGDGRDTELYPDANLKYPDEYDIKPPSVQLAAGGSLPFVVTPIVPSNPNIDC